MGSRRRQAVSVFAAVAVVAALAPVAALATPVRGARAADASTAAATGVRFTVDTTQDAADPTPDGQCGQLVGCSLREAIQEANATPAKDTIAFDITGGDTTIKPGTELPDITAPLVIDGSTQPGYRGIPIVEIDGENAPGANGLTITAGKSIVKAITVNRFDGDGIVIQDGDGRDRKSTRLNSSHIL